MKRIVPQFVTSLLVCFLVQTLLFSDEPKWAYLENDQIKVGLKLESGGAVAWLSQAGSDRNFVNHFDQGRLIQQSYYGQVDGSRWNGKPWRWNPVQGGDWLGRPATVLQFDQSEQELYVKTRPRHWAAGMEIEDVLFEQWVTLNGPVVHIRFRMLYSGGETHPRHDQEIPAVFVDRSLATLVTTEQGKIIRRQPAFPNERYNVPDHWAAYVDEAEFGLGVLVPQADEITSYRVGEIGQRGACSYFAPLDVFAVTPGMVYEYDCYLTIGPLKQIQMRFAAVSDQHSSEPKPGE